MRKMCLLHVYRIEADTLARMPGEGDDVRSGRSNPEYVMQRDPGVRKFTWQQLSKLNQRHNAHVAVRGKVYDVSGFIAKHPGGADQLLLGAGRDVTALFESYHNFNVYKVLEKYYVGELESNELPVFSKQEAFYKTLRERVDKCFKDNNIDPKISYWMFLRYFVFVLLTLLCWCAMMQLQASLILAVPLSVGWGFFAAMVTMTCGHDASHFCITHKPWVWKAVGFLHEFLVGTSLYTWTYQHTVGHHVYTNIEGVDPDIVTSPNDIRRIKWEQKWLPRYFYQHVYMPMLYCVLGVKTRLQDFHLIYSLRNGGIRMNRPTNSQLLVLVAGKLGYVIFRFVIPWVFMPWHRLLLLNLIADVITSYWIACLDELSHVVSEVEWLRPTEDNIFHRDWAEMQVTTTLDYATDSWFWSIFTGALNHQTAHHLFPGVIQSHYPLITPIVRQTCEEFGIQYNYVDTTWEAFNCHVNHLKNLGQHKELKTE